MLIIGYFYKVLKKLFVLEWLERLLVISIKTNKHDIVYLKNQCLLTIFIGTTGGISLLAGNYYVNLRGRLFFCNYKHRLKAKSIDVYKFCFNSKFDYIIPLSILESILLEDDSPKYSKIKYPQLLNGEHYVCIRNENAKKNIVINKAGGFFHFYIEVLPLLIQYVNKEFNIYFIIEDRPFYKSILSFYKINYIPICTYPNRNVYNIDMPRCYPTSDDIIKWYNYNNDAFKIDDQIPKKLYITRRNERARRIINEEKLIKTLVIKGFEIIDPGTLDYINQVKYFRNAQIIVAAHGAALSNIVWCKKDVILIELNGDIDVRWHFAKMALFLNFKYQLILGKTIDDVYFETNIPIIEKTIMELLNEI